MTATADAPLFENRDWTVSPDGLEHKGTGYFIEREQVGDRRGDGLWSWPVHMSEKSWVRPESFAEAFMGAVLAYGVSPDAELAASFVASGRQGAERDGPRFPPAAGPDAIRIASADEPDLPGWALPLEPSGRPLRRPGPALPVPGRRDTAHRHGAALSRKLLGWLGVAATGKRALAQARERLP